MGHLGDRTEVTGATTDPICPRPATQDRPVSSRPGFAPRPGIGIFAPPEPARLAIDTLEALPNNL